LAINGISGDGGHRNVNLWKRRALPDGSLSDAVSGTGPGARACSGARSSACTRAGASACACARTESLARTK
jgi:hypothetical protein